ncbi:MAG: hypothetical protein AAGG01_13175 [Planctomycetota bacterium]
MFRTLALSAAAAALATAASAQSYIPNNGLIVIEMESSGAPGDWTESTSTNGFVGDSYIVWDGPNLFNSPGQGVFGFDFEVNEPGTWNLRIRNRHENPDATEENDVWIRMNGGGWVKTFSNLPGSVGAWTWESRFDFGHGNQPNASYNLSVGTHRIEFSGRSFGFKMDRLHLFRAGAIGQTDPEQPESIQRFGEDYGSANANSTGQVSRIDALGYMEASENNVVLSAFDLPSRVPGFFIASQSSGFTANPAGSSGNLLLDGMVSRFDQQLDMTTANGTAALRIDLNSIPTPTGTTTATSGQTWNFQFWHRDMNGSGPTSNFSRGLRVVFE